MNNTQELDRNIIESILNKKGRKIVKIDLSRVEGASINAFVICEGRSTSQVTAIADGIREDILKSTGRKPLNYEGYTNAQWIIVDYGEIMVHVFVPEVRERYCLEELWSDGKCETIPDID